MESGFQRNTIEGTTFSLVGQYQISDRVNIGAVFVYATGNAISLPERRWFSLEENRIITVWSKRNQYRLNPYHRLDISLTIDAKAYKEKLNAETNKDGESEKEGYFFLEFFCLQCI